MPVATIRQYTQLALEGPSTVSQRLALLESHRASVNLRIDELRRNLVLLDSKIATYRKTQLERAEDMGICWPGQA
jgi:DNA-binding transcriptional MerR regulator